MHKFKLAPSPVAGEKKMGTKKVKVEITHIWGWDLLIFYMTLKFYKFSQNFIFSTLRNFFVIRDESG